MWLRALVIVGMLGLLSACGDDSSDETRTPLSDASSTSATGSTGTTGTTGPDTSGAGDGPDGSEPGTSAPPGGGTLPDRPADLVGEVTEHEGDRFLVEEHPGRDGGRKAWVGIVGPVFRAGAGGDPEPASPSDVAVGQRVSAWTEICAESYPEQCGAQALVIR